MYSVIPSPAAEGWALWNHRNLQVTSESATVPDEDEGEDEAQHLGDLDTPGPDEVATVANVTEEDAETDSEETGWTDGDTDGADDEGEDDEDDA